MKTKYQRYNKEEKKYCKKKYYQTSEGKMMNIRLTRLTLTGIIGILFSFYLLVSKDTNISKWVIYLLFGVLMLFSVIFIIAAWRLRLKKLNEYAVKYLK